MNGYCFVEFENPDDARAAFDEKAGQGFLGEPLQVEFAKQRPPPSAKGQFRLKVSKLPEDISWQDVKDLIYDITTVRPSYVRNLGPGVASMEFYSQEILDDAISRVNGYEFNNETLAAEVDDSPFTPMGRGGDRRDRGPPRGGSRGGFRGDRGGDRGFRGPPRAPRGGYGSRGPPRDDYRDDYRPRDDYRSRDEYRPRDDYRSSRGPPRDDYRPRGGDRYDRYDDGGYDSRPRDRSPERY